MQALIYQEYVNVNPHKVQDLLKLVLPFRNLCEMSEIILLEKDKILRDFSMCFKFPELVRSFQFFLFFRVAHSLKSGKKFLHVAVYLHVLL